MQVGDILRKKTARDGSLNETVAVATQLMRASNIKRACGRDCRADRRPAVGMFTERESSAQLPSTARPASI